MENQQLKKKAKGSKLRNRFIVVVMALSGIPVVALGLITLTLIERSHRYDVSLMERQLIDQKTEEIGKFLADTINILRLRVGFEEKAEISLADQEFILDGFFRENPAFKEISFVSLQGQETLRKTSEGARQETRYVGGSEYFAKSVMGDSFVGEISYLPESSFAMFSAPVLNRQGDIIQVLAAKVDLSLIAGSIGRGRLGQDGYLALIDRSGNLISQGSSSLIDSGTNFSQVKRIQDIMQGKSFDGLSKSDRYASGISEELVVGAGKRIGETGWVLIAEWPVKDADAILSKIRNQVFGIFALAVVFALAVAPFLIGRLVAPIRQLESIAREVEKGNFEEKAVINTNDELEELGEAFNKMTRGLKRLRELQNEFVFIASHELRTPVTAIIWGTEAILRGKAKLVSTGIRENINIIRESGQRLSLLIDELLILARAEAGKLQVEVSACDISESIRRTILTSKPLAEHKKISLSYEEPKSSLTVMGDPKRMEQIMVNLIGNGIKYNKEGGWLKVYHEDLKDRVITHVEDGGVGISDKEQGRIFEKFFRAETGRRMVSQGTGLGLFIAKELAERMGGKIWFKSKKGEGSTFSFSLPKANRKKQ